jgi:hypothetical protein
LRSTDIERYTTKFLKNWETQLFQKYLGIRFASDTKAALLGFAEVSAFPKFSADCIFQLHSAGVGSRRLIPSCVQMNATWYEKAGSWLNGDATIFKILLKYFCGPGDILTDMEITLGGLSSSSSDGRARRDGSIQNSDFANIEKTLVGYAAERTRPDADSRKKIVAGASDEDTLELSREAKRMLGAKSANRPDSPESTLNGSGDADRQEAISASLLGRAAEADAEDGENGEDKAQPAAGGGDTVELSPEAQKMVDSLKARDREVRAHEAAHVAAGAGVVTGGAQFTQQRGPDGNMYAIGGEVGIDASPIPNDPEGTMAKARQIASAALAPADPSPQDRAVAASARQMEAKAASEMANARADERNSRNTQDSQDSAAQGRQAVSAYTAASANDAANPIARAYRAVA